MTKRTADGGAADDGRICRWRELALMFHTAKRETEIRAWLISAATINEVRREQDNGIFMLKELD
jgi:hypothetical protein